MPGPSSLFTRNTYEVQIAWHDVSGNVLFWVESQPNEFELWSSNGTAAGTGSIAGPMGWPVRYQRSQAEGGLILLQTGEAQQPTLTATDGTAAGSRLVGQPHQQTSSYPFDKWDLGHGRTFLRTVGDSSGTWIREKSGAIESLDVLSPDVAQLSYGPRTFTPLDGRLYFGTRGNDAALYSIASDWTDLRQHSDPQLDGTTGWTVFEQAGSILVGSTLASPTLPYHFGLKRYDPVSESLTEIAGLEIRGWEWTWDTGPAQSGGLAFLRSDDGLWSLGVSNAVGQLVPGVATQGQLATASGDHVFFLGSDAVAGEEPYSLDTQTLSATLLETAAGPGTAVAELRLPTWPWVNPVFLTSEEWSPPLLRAVSGEAFYFVGESASHGSELWMTTATGPPQVVHDIALGPASSHPSNLTPVHTSRGHRLFFRADDGIHGAELWVTDGTSAGTQSLGDIRAGGESALPQDLHAVDGVLLFTAYDDTYGRELWVSDGTRQGTHRYGDVAPGQLSSSPSSFPGADRRSLVLGKRR